MNPKLIKPLYYKIQLQLQMKQIQIILEITLEALKNKLKYIYLRKIKVQNEK